MSQGMGSICPHRIFTQIFTAALFIITKRWNNPLSIKSWMDKQMWYIQTMEYYSAIKRKEVLIHATTWINLENK